MINSNLYKIIYAYTKYKIIYVNVVGRCAMLPRILFNHLREETYEYQTEEILYLLNEYYNSYYMHIAFYIDLFFIYIILFVVLTF
jgi:hypothetical protein